MRAPKTLTRAMKDQGHLPSQLVNAEDEATDDVEKPLSESCDSASTDETVGIDNHKKPTKQKGQKKFNEMHPGWWPQWYAPFNDANRSIRAGMREKIQQYEEAGRDPRDMWDEYGNDGCMVKAIKNNPRAKNRLTKATFEKVQLPFTITKPGSNRVRRAKRRKRNCTPSHQGDINDSVDARSPSGVTSVDDDAASSQPKPLADSDCPQQEDAFNCGIFALAFLQSLVNGEGIPTQVNARELRTFFAMHIEGNGPSEREITVQETTSTSYQTPPEQINPVTRSVSLPADSSIPASFLVESQNFLKSWRREKERLAMATKTFEKKAMNLSTLKDELTLVQQRLQKSEETVRELRNQIKESGDTETLHNDIRDLIAKLPPAEGSSFHSKWLSELRSNAEMTNDSMLAESKSLPKRLSNAESELDGTRKRITQLEGQIQLRRRDLEGIGNEIEKTKQVLTYAPSQAGPDISISEPCSISDPNKTIDAITKKLSVYLAAKHSPPFTAPAGFDDALNALESPDHIVQVFLSRGFWCWLAYFLATKDPKTQPPLSLSGIPYDTLSVIAGLVSEAPVDDTLVKRIQSTLWVARRGSTRRSDLSKAGISGFPPRPSTMPVSHPEANSLKRPRGQFFEDPDEPAQVAQRPRLNNTILDTTIPVSLPAAGQPTQELHSLDHISQPMLKVNPPDGYKWPDARRIPSVFPQSSVT
ncbi:hypothetical protein Forpi1262_v017122 [Fusarium oxysporum f. sp. raphani]|uniref:Ubiquitin-like protease family profile domain-containing protein n=1 Tax=Fusarium oxysporum f. sp. raphani TaxID=96318 RepID=A0A8J5P7J5_FUSOX|nr:hypothetical protein Forpi1262_v017122 [Fusarium oxysporum f. sp. raphani]